MAKGLVDTFAKALIVSFIGCHGGDMSHKRKQFIDDVVGRILDPDPNDINPHEIDGDVYPEGVQEFDATETLPNPLESLHAEETSPIHQERAQIINPGDQVGRFVTVPIFLPTANGYPSQPGVEIFTLRSKDYNSIFSVFVQSRPIPDVTAPAGLALQGFGDVKNVSYLTGPTFPSVPHQIGIEFGAGGAQFQAHVDVDPGQIFTVGGSYIRLLAYGVGRTPGGLVPNTVDIGAFVSLLPRGTPRAAKTSFNIGQIGAAGIALASPGNGIPSFAKSLRVIRAPAASDMLIRFTGWGGIVLGEISVPANTEMTNADIPGGAQYATVSSTAGLNDATAIWEIAL